MWHCDHCLRDWKTEDGFMRHHCPERARLEEVKSARGQTAYAMYGEWMRLQKRSVPPIETFMISKQYNYFIKFVDWAEKTAIPNLPQFVKLMVETDTAPLLWCRSNTYSLYLQWYDNVYPPLEQFLETLDRLLEIAKDLKVQPSEVYAAMGATEIATMVRRRKLSPWLLIVSQRFLRYVSVCQPEAREMLNAAIDFGAYAAKIKNKPELAAELRRACEASNL